MAKGVVIVELSINLEKRFHPNGYKNSSVYLTILRFLLTNLNLKFQIYNKTRPPFFRNSRTENISFSLPLFAFPPYFSRSRSLDQLDPIIRGVTRI